MTPPTTTKLLATAALLAALSPRLADATRLAFHFDGMDHAGCKSGTFDMQLNELKFVCNGEDDLCQPGDTVTVQGHFEAKSSMPMDVATRTKACKYFGTMCTPTLNIAEESLRDDWHMYSMYGNETYPSPGLYGFERQFQMPKDSLTDFPFAGFQFNLVTDFEAEDYQGLGYTPHMKCHAQFTTVNYDTFTETGETGKGFSTFFGSKWSVLGLVGLMGGYMARKRRLASASQPALSLDDDAGVVETDFEMMPPSSGEDDASVRV